MQSLGCVRRFEEEVKTFIYCRGDVGSSAFVEEMLGSSAIIKEMLGPSAIVHLISDPVQESHIAVHQLLLHLLIGPLFALLLLLFSLVPSQVGHRLTAFVIGRIVLSNLYRSFWFVILPFILPATVKRYNLPYSKMSRLQQIT